MPKITFIGAGSTVFAKNLMSDIMQFPELADSTIILHDIDKKRLTESMRPSRRVTSCSGVSSINPIQFPMSPPRRSLQMAQSSNTRTGSFPTTRTPPRKRGEMQRGTTITTSMATSIRIHPLCTVQARTDRPN